MKHWIWKIFSNQLWIAVLVTLPAQADIALLLQDETRASVFQHDNGSIYYRICEAKLPLSGVDRNCATKFQEPGHPTAYATFVVKMYRLYGVPNRFSYYPGALDEVSNRLEELSRAEQEEKLDKEEQKLTQIELRDVKSAFDRIRRVHKEIVEHLSPNPLSEGFDLHRHKTGHRIVAALSPYPVYFEDDSFVWRHIKDGQSTIYHRCKWPWTNHAGYLSHGRILRIMGGLGTSPNQTNYSVDLCYMEVPE